MNDKALELLMNITNDKAVRQMRSLDLLKQPEKDSDGWFICVPSCFNEALDIYGELESEDEIQAIHRFISRINPKKEI